MSKPSQRELIQRGHAWIESQLPEDEPDHVPDWVVVGLMCLGDRLARERALEDGAQAVDALVVHLRKRSHRMGEYADGKVAGAAEAAEVLRAMKQESRDE